MSVDRFAQHVSSAGQELHRAGKVAGRYFQVIVALLWREEQSRRNNPLEAFAELLEPILLIGIMSFAAWFLNRRNVSPLGDNPVLFYATGLFILYYFIYVSSRMTRSVGAPDRRFPIEQRLDHIIVHLILKTGDYIVLGFVLFGFIFIFFTHQAMPYDIIPVVQGMIAMVMLGFGWGIVNLIVSRKWRAWLYVHPALSRTLMIFTGVLYVVDFIAPNARHVLSYIPLVHAVSLFRLGFFPTQPTIVLDKAYLAYCCLAAVCLGLMLERLTRRVE